MDVVLNTYNATVLVFTEQLAIDELLLNLTLQPRQTLFREWLRRPSKVTALWDS